MPISGGPLNIERWDPARHDRSGFDCGVTRLNNYLNLSAKKQQNDDMTRVYVAVAPDSPVILGYSAINVGMMNVSQLAVPPKGTPGHSEIPVLFLGQIAVDRKAQKHGIGSILMHHVFEKACVIADQAGCHAILLDVMSDGDKGDFENRKQWYGSFGFQSFVSRDARMFMTMRQVRAIVAQG